MSFPWTRGQNGGAEAVPGRLTIDVGRSHDDYELTLSGVLDLSSVARLEAAIDAAMITDAKRVTVDLDGLEFIDSTGVAAILQATRRTDGNGRLRMTRGTGEVEQLFRLTALDLVLPFE
jgi:anti-anti-sigma factor